jgi:hypothetical protein
MPSLGYASTNAPHPTRGVARAVPPVASPMLVDDQLMRLGAETFPLTAISGVAVVWHRKTFWAAQATFWGGLLLWAGLEQSSGAAIGLGAVLLLAACGLWPPRYCLRVNINSGRMIEVRCANKQIAFAGLHQVETALAQRVQPVVRG